MESHLVERYGIAGFQDHLYETTEELVAAVGDQLSQLPGHCLERVYAQWSAEDPTWWKDAVVVLVFDDCQLEMVAAKCFLSLTLDSFQVDPDQLFGELGEDFVLHWEQDPWPLQKELNGNTLRELRALERAHPDYPHDFMFRAVEFVFDSGTIVFSDGGDELALHFNERPQDYGEVWRVARRWTG